MNTPTATTTCPDLEELAAFADGRLSGAARDAVVEHLADCEDCYEIYAETLRVQEDLGPRAVPLEDDPPLTVLTDAPVVGHSPLTMPADAPVAVQPPLAMPAGAPVVVHPRSYRPVRWAVPAAALAAAAALAVVVLPRWLGTGTSVIPVGDVAALVADSSLGDVGEWYEHDWPRKRGMGPELGTTDIDSAKRAFRLGVRAVDLEAAIRLEDRDTAEVQTYAIERLLNGDDFLRFFSPQYQELQSQILNGTDQQQILTSESRIRKLLMQDADPAFSFYHSFGMWTETARLAALTGHAEYFTGRDFRRGLGKLRDGELADGVVGKLDKVEELAGTPAALDELSQALEEIISGEGVR